MYKVPSSECVMSMRIAGKTIRAFRFTYDDQYTATVWIDGQDPFQNTGYTALISEVIPFELRDKNDGLGTIQVICLKCNELNPSQSTVCKECQ